MKEYKEIEGELWKPIKDFENYEISNLGRVKNNRGKLLTPIINNTGYLQVYLCNKTERKKFLINRLVAKAFLDITDNNKSYVLRKDKDPEKNCLCNISYGDKAEYLSKKVIVTKQGEPDLIFNSIKETALYFNVERSSIRKWINKNRKQTKLKEYTFKFL